LYRVRNRDIVPVCSMEITIFPTTFVEKTAFSPMYIFCTFAGNQMTADV
jgi:hypothetical protein